MARLRVRDRLAEMVEDGFWKVKCMTKTEVLLLRYSPQEVDWEASLNEMHTRLTERGEAWTITDLLRGSEELGSWYMQTMKHEGHVPLERVVAKAWERGLTPWDEVWANALEVDEVVLGDDDMRLDVSGRWIDGGPEAVKLNAVVDAIVSLDEAGNNDNLDDLVDSIRQRAWQLDGVDAVFIDRLLHRFAYNREPLYQVLLVFELSIHRKDGCQRAQMKQGPALIQALGIRWGDDLTCFKILPVLADLYRQGDFKGVVMKILTYAF